MALAQRLAGELGSDESGLHYDHSHQPSGSSLDFMILQILKNPREGSSSSVLDALIKSLTDADWGLSLVVP